MRLRTFVDEQPVAVSPDGRQVAYVLNEPDLKKNRNETVLYVRELPKTDDENPQRSPGKVVLRTQGIRQMQWLADGRRCSCCTISKAAKEAWSEWIESPENSRQRAPRTSMSKLLPRPQRAGGWRLLVTVPDKTQVDRFASPRGVVITEEDFLLDVDARGTAKKKPTLTAVVVADADGGALTVFGGKRSLTLMRPAISPNGRAMSPFWL